MCKYQSGKKAIHHSHHYILILSPAIEDEYEGPGLEDGKVTLKFVTELMEFYKNQKKLHKKYAYKVIFGYNTIQLLYSTQTQ